MNSVPALPPDLLRVTQRLRLPYLRRHAPEVIATAKAQRWDPAEVVRVLLEEEVKGRDDATRRNRRKAAGFPSGKTFEGWVAEASSIPVPTQNGLQTLEWIHRRECLSVSGPSGTGKSHCETQIQEAELGFPQAEAGGSGHDSKDTLAVPCPCFRYVCLLPPAPARAAVKLA